MPGHGVCCACDVCDRRRDIDPYDDDRDGKSIARAAEHDPRD